MSSLKINIRLSLLWSSLSLISFAAQPALAESINNHQTNIDRDRVTLSQFKLISTQAQDLLLPSSNSSFTNITLPTYQLVQRELNLEKFCQNYPYNSQCSGTTPSNEPRLQERSPISVPQTPPAPTESQDIVSQQKSGWAIAPEVSSLGLGGHVVRKITPNFNARIGVNAFKLGINIEETDFDYEGDLNLFNVSSLIDVHPFRSSGFRISGGLIVGNNNIEGTADVSEQVADGLGEVEVFGQPIDIRQLIVDSELATIDTDIDINNSVSPYLGIGGGNAVGEDKGLGFWWNLGVVFGGSPEVEVTSNISDDLPESLREEVETETNRILEDEEQDLEDELDFLKIYPVLSLGLSYQF
ncbi:MAG TPA: hypothetical protein V6C71_26130 [Coleofasciculaceae cyanobacterium]